MRTWKIEGPPEIVDGMVMYVMTSWSDRPARRARKPPMAWMPSWELPARRITTSGMAWADAAASSPAEGVEGLTMIGVGREPGQYAPVSSFVKACFSKADAPRAY